MQSRGRREGEQDKHHIAYHNYTAYRCGERDLRGVKQYLANWLVTGPEITAESCSEKFMKFFWIRRREIAV